MARRKISEINAGSMADIAFLLLIFFLVTTTMEVDSGIGKNLPFKLDIPPQPSLPVNERDVLEINANLNDGLMVENEEIQLDELYDIVYSFYTVNRNKDDIDSDMPNYNLITSNDCNLKIESFEDQLEETPSSMYLASEITKWKTKRELCLASPKLSYKEISNMAVIRFEIQSKTSYGLYIEVHNVIKTVVNELRKETCEEMKWGDYYALRDDNPDDQVTIKKLRILVPERILEPKMDL
ncbi:MAG: biopolymer transport protein ExbD [Crocinitomix sp.]|jgi:biopolymer transport protein ExbD